MKTWHMLEDGMHFRLPKTRSLFMALVVLLLTVCIIQPAMAVRPFVTDDAAVVGAKLTLLETSLRLDKTRLQNLNLLAYGPTEKLELTAGFIDGFLTEAEDATGKFSIAGPLAQAKYLFKEPTPNGLPGLAAVVGFNTPYGTNNFGNASWGEFVYLASTASLGDDDRVLIHANVGTAYGKPEDTWKFITTWGIGTQIRIIGGLNAVGEIFSGDPYSQSSGRAFQAGFRYFISRWVQADATVGSGLRGSPEIDNWAGCGLRMIFGAPRTPSTLNTLPSQGIR
jgi:hypothetical protein